MRKFQPKKGNLTNKIKYEYLNLYIKQNKLSENIFDNEEVTSLYAPTDLNKTLYFWQIYSIIGPEPIRKLITLFYTSIFESTTNLWFKEEFIELGSLEHHINKQTEFWLDIMGGGPLYKSTIKKLHMKHKLVQNIMTEKGANIWMSFMINSINTIKEDLYTDRRIIPCLINFLNFFMLKYGREFDFNFYEIKISSL